MSGRVRKPAGGVATRKRPTQSDVARLAGVSLAVVSAVFNNNRSSSVRVGPATVARVQDAVRTLGYVPNLVARSLAGGEQRIFGVFTFEPAFPSDQKNFFYPFLFGIERGVEEIGYDLLLFTSTTVQDRPRHIFRDGANRLGVADGAILLGQEPDKAELRQLVDDGYPFVIIGRREIEGAEANWVAADYAEATGGVVRHLVELGHAKIAYLGEARPREPQIDRESGYWSAVGTHGLPRRRDWLLRIDASEVAGAWLATLIDQGVTAILTESTAHAEAAERALRERGLAVPDHLSIGVLGAPLYAEPGHERWTRFAIPREEMGRRAVHILRQVVQAGAAQSAVQERLSCTLERGATAAPPRGD